MLNNSDDLAKLMNLERLEEVSGGDLEFQQDLLQAYFEDMAIEREHLQQAIATEDLPAIAHHAHTIKGASSNVGCSSIQETAAILEQKARQQESGSDLVTLAIELDKRFVLVEEIICNYF